MRTAILILCVFAVLSVVHAEETLVEISWDKLQAEGRLQVGEVIPADGQTGFAQLKITNTEAKPFTVHIVSMEQPGITEATYAVTGRVRYEGVEGPGYVEMWSIFPGGGKYFTKTLGDGSMAPIAASSGWRDLLLPFSTEGTSQKPSRLEINLVLPGKGTVYLGPLRLVEPAPGINCTTPPGGPLLNALGLIAGIFSAFVGLFTIVTVLLVMRGKARRFVSAMWFVFMSVGVAYIFAAQFFQEPASVYYPLLLTGIIHTALAGVAIIVIRRQYERWEFRQMSAQDAIFEVRKERVER